MSCMTHNWAFIASGAFESNDLAIASVPHMTDVYHVLPSNLLKMDYPNRRMVRPFPFPVLLPDFFRVPGYLSELLLVSLRLLSIRFSYDVIMGGHLVPMTVRDATTSEP